MTVNAFDAFEFADNPDPRCPVIAILDCSDSMEQVRPGESRSPLESLNGALDTLITAINDDPLSKRRIELSFLPYGTHASDPTPFVTVENIFNGSAPLPDLKPMGVTSTGAALNKAMDAIEARKQVYKSQAVPYYQGIALLISDGLSTDDLTSASARMAEMEAGKKISFFAVGVQGADIDQLSSIGNPAKTALALDGMKFDELFVWLSQSAASVSASTPGDKVAVPSPAGWAEM